MKDPDANTCTELVSQEHGAEFIISEGNSAGGNL